MKDPSSFQITLWSSSRTTGTFSRINEKALKRAQRCPKHPDRESLVKNHGSFLQDAPMNPGTSSRTKASFKTSLAKPPGPLEPLHKIAKLTQTLFKQFTAGEEPIEHWHGPLTPTAGSCKPPQHPTELSQESIRTPENVLQDQETFSVTFRIYSRTPGTLSSTKGLQETPGQVWLPDLIRSGLRSKTRQNQNESWPQLSGSSACRLHPAWTICDWAIWEE